MLAEFLAWWVAQLIEVPPGFVSNNAAWRHNRIIVEIDSDGRITAAIPARRGTTKPIALEVAAALAGSRPVVLRPAAASVLTKQHTIPTAPLRQLTQILNHELVRITPFQTGSLFWQWDIHSRSADRMRVTVTLTMVPKTALAATFASLDALGLQIDFLDLGGCGKRRLLPVSNLAIGAGDTSLVRQLGWACACLVVTALALPPSLQALARHQTEAAIAELQPAVTEVEALRRRINAADAGQDSLTQEAMRTGDALQSLASLTRILPDDTYLIDLSLRGQQVTLSGRSPSAPRLITVLSANPAIQDAAFTAPVTRVEGTIYDVFSLKVALSPRPDKQ